MASHFALFVDLENCGGKKSMLMDVIERVKIRGDILIGKVYGYTDSYSDLKEILLSNTFAVVPSLRFGRNQKNSLDIQLVIDALDVAYTNPLIDSFCIVSGDSDYVPLVGKLKTMGKFVLGISRSEAASGVFMNACSEFQFLESVASGKERAQGQEIEALTLADVNDLIVTILKESDSGEMLASEVKSVLLRLRPNFSEKSVGFSTFGKLIARLSQQFGAFSVESEQFNVIVSLNQPHVTAGEQITRENYIRIFSRILSYTSAACDARMAGAMIPVMSNSGSGNQGIAATLPVVVYAEETHASEEQMIRALTLSHLTVIYIKQSLGRLSALCGCVVAATGSSCGITYLMGGAYEQVAAAVKNMIANLTGMICDGAKPSCSMKLTSGVSTAVLSAMMAMDGHCVTPVEGIIEEDVDKCIRNLTAIGRDGMNETDRLVLGIMTHKC